MCTEIFNTVLNYYTLQGHKAHSVCVCVCPCVHEYTLKPCKSIGRTKFDRRTTSFKDDLLQYKPGKKNKFC